MSLFSSVELEKKPCPNGCSVNDEQLFVGRDRLHGLPGEFRVVKCCNCDLIRTNPRPTPETIGFYYPDDYGPYLGTRIKHEPESKQSLSKQLFRKAYKNIFRFNTNVIPPLPSGRMLEIGCASGSFLAVMAEKGWSVQGIELSAKAAESARSAGFSVTTGPIESAPSPSTSVDLVVGWMVLEHLHDPVYSLAKLAEWTRPDGWLVVSVPNVASADFRIFREAGYALHLPAHLYHYTPESLSKILAESGWRVEKIFHQRTLSNYFASFGNKLEDTGAPSWLVGLFKPSPRKMLILNIVFYPLAWLLSFSGQTGRMTVWASKIDKEQSADG
ncbi:MAG: class I SAM-dependent methyltransferase [Gammaproteobacteria bacterium]|nr:class I SAM-dependent methyltransferase [Gammaproteobacteria bacterium]